MSNSQEKTQTFNSSRYIKVYLDDTGAETKVKTVFSKKPFSPEQFTHTFMGILEAYTASLLETNTNEAVFDHFNNVFGTFLNKLLPADKIYERSDSHKQFKELTDSTLGQEDSEELKKEAEDNRLAAYLLAKDILIQDVGLSEETVDLYFARRLGLLNAPNEVKDDEVQ